MHLVPITPIRPEDLHKAALTLIAQAGYQDSPELRESLMMIGALAYENGDGVRRQQQLDWKRGQTRRRRAG